jgi:hypothetical protein
MSLVSRLQELFDERRGDARNAVSRPADLLINGSVKKAILLNVSRSGAMLDAAFPPEEGASLVLRCAQVEVPARVVWVRHYRFGLRFDQKIEAWQVASLVKPDEAYIF